MGTAHVLEACRRVDGVKAIVAVTTAEVYTNQDWHCWCYRETDRLGGQDPQQLIIRSPHAPRP
jgi:CDP-glucose 4,6-dehydratase